MVGLVSSRKGLQIISFCIPYLHTDYLLLYTLLTHRLSPLVSTTYTQIISSCILYLHTDNKQYYSPLHPTNFLWVLTAFPTSSKVSHDETVPTESHVFWFSSVRDISWSHMLKSAISPGALWFISKRPSTVIITLLANYRL